MTRAEKAKLMVVGTLTLLAGITGGWEGAAAVFLGCAFVLGVWTVISAGVDALMGPQEPPRGDVTIYWQSDIDPRDGDPTRPEKEPVPDNVIELRKGEWERRYEKTNHKN